MTPIAMFPIMAALSLPMPKEEFKDSVFSISKAGEVVVTATRTPKLLKNTPVQTRVISRRDIERSDATNIQDLLTQTMPGAEFTYAMNQQTHLNFSGFGGQGLLFLVDGERMAGETMDDVDFSRITLENVERIEIVRGAASALYGSNAVGGVVNVITRNNAKSWTAQVNARLAKHGEQRYTAAMGLANKHVSNSLCANFSQTDNYDVHSAPNPVTRIITTIYGDKVLNLNDRFRWQPTEQLTFTARAGYYWRETVRTADVPEHYRSFSGGAKMEWRPTAHDNLSLTYAFDQYDKSDHLRRQNLELRDYSNVQNSVKLLYNHSFSKQHLLTLGVDYLHDYLMNVNLKNRIREQDCLGVYAQHDWEISPEWEVVGGVRYDYLSDRNLSHLTPRLNLRYRPQHNLTLRLGYGMGFRSPTLKERYYNFDMSGIWIVEGTPDLRPEKSHNFTFSAEYAKPRYNVTASVYYNHVQDKIATAAPYYKKPGDKLPYLPYVNLADFKVYGGELGLNTRWNNGFSARFTYAYTKEELPTDNDGNSINNQYIPARAHALNVWAEYEHRWSKLYRTNFCLSGRLLSATENQEYVDYYDISKGTVKVKYPAYTVWKLATTHQFGQAVKLSLALDNLFNYRPRHYYLNAPLTDGINFQVGLSIDIDKF